MSNTVLKVENVSKQYRLGQLGTGTISHDLNRMWARLRGKEDPYLKVGDTNDRSKAGGSDYVWSLKDINFEVKQGEVLGIIGKNGAGKSTLLKILSQVTTPTTGQVKVKGRIAALLEVGTGFHPELTGRENIFLNGAILGMTKAEIKSKLDEIVDFSGVAKYLDTPVKRYSSGMMVRLGFAVAAHLEPEILIVDEVLAVGDAEFQKKCLGKMKDVSGEGRTVLFVSHNMDIITNLCNKGLLLQQGEISSYGNIHETVNKYLRSGSLQAKINLESRKDRVGNGELRFKNVELCLNGIKSNTFKTGSDCSFIFSFSSDSKREIQSYLSVVVFDSSGKRIISFASGLNNSKIGVSADKKIEMKIEKLALAPGKYMCNFYLDADPKSLIIIDKIHNAFELTVEEGDYHGFGSWHGIGIDVFFSNFSINSYESKY
ncbi:MAG: ATP-binding cassette domain-containing protein [Bacteroidetes bacterium]|nr:ATP-binding cassette domain-containing protein [Bacteroidota bacterium]